MVAVYYMTGHVTKHFLEKLRGNNSISVCSSMERWPNLTFRLPNILKLDNFGSFSVLPFSLPTIVAIVAQDFGVSFL